MERYRISGVPVTRGTELVGILTNRDLRFETNLDQKVGSVMTSGRIGWSQSLQELILRKQKPCYMLIASKNYSLSQKAMTRLV